MTMSLMAVVRLGIRYELFQQASRAAPGALEKQDR
jgi:hypothetical protein